MLLPNLVSSIPNIPLVSASVRAAMRRLEVGDQAASVLLSQLSPLLLPPWLLLPNLIRLLGSGSEEIDLGMVITGATICGSTGVFGVEVVGVVAVSMLDVVVVVPLIDGVVLLGVELAGLGVL